MAACTFFGHRDCPASIRPALRSVLLELIEEKGVSTFYVGSQGAFDALAASVLQELRTQYPHIRCRMVLAYFPRQQDAFPLETLPPEGIEAVPRRFAISWRNRWMLRQADYVVTYVTHGWGGAAQFAALAQRQGKFVYDLAPKSRAGGACGFPAEEGRPCRTRKKEKRDGHCPVSFPKKEGEKQNVLPFLQ